MTEQKKSFPKSFVFVVAASFALFSNSFGDASIHFDPTDDVATVEYEPNFQFSTEGSESRSDQEFSRYSLQAFFPLYQFGEKQVFGGVRGEIFTRLFRDSTSTLNSHNLNRHALSLGSDIVKTSSQESAALFTLGYNGDLEVESDKTLSGEFIYAHFYTGIKKCKMGLGIDFLWFGNEWLPYPLVFLEWWMLDNTKLRLNADRAEIRQFLGQKLCATLGTRYNLYYGAFAQKSSPGQFKSMVSESLLFETGLEYPLTQNLFARVKFEKTYWGEERFTNENRTVQTNNVVSGTAVKLCIAYAL